ncbi:MAG: YdeI/OmpD-associated family protein [Flavobacteriales bacterium]|nr:hypothetical protein [Flavobacteriales bacterium]MCC6578593.1 YdeI/OmpD-associated family protein [Flavobacteriales bacterium]NUQ15978.1 YdeI/OmpD-associated family protein [Flavobacteriales bacterium]
MLPQEQINSYIAEQPEWQRRTLVRLRQLIHATGHDIEEAWRANVPHYDLGGSMIGTVGLKQAVCVWFHKGALMKDAHRLFEKPEKDDAKGLRKYRIKEGEAIDEKAFLDLVKQAVKLNLSGAKLTDAKPGRKAPALPEELEVVLRRDEEAWAHWEALPAAHRRAYVEWITDAGKEEIRKRRVAEAYQRIREGRTLDDKDPAKV